MFSSTPAVFRSRQSPSPVKMPRPFSVSIFKGPTLAASQGPVNSKFGAPPQTGGHMGWFPSWSLFNSHFAAPKPPIQRAATYPPYMSGPTPGDNRSIPQNFYIYPNSHVNGAYIYETSFSSKSEVFSTSDYDSSSSASYTPSSFSPILSSTDSLVTASSSSPNHPTTSLPTSTSGPKSSSDDNTRSFYPSQVSNGGYGPSLGRNEAGSAPRFNGYNGPQRPQIGYLPEATPPMADDHRTLVNTEYNARTSHYPPFRGASANASHSGTDYRSDNAPSVSSNPSDIMLHPPSSSPERQGAGDANRQPSSTSRYETSSRTSPHDVNPPPEPPNRLQLVPLPPVSEDGSSRGLSPHQSNASSRRDSTFMPYYFPDPLSVASYPQQYTSQNAGGDSLPLPPGLVFPDVPLRRSPDTQSAAEMRSDSPSTDSAISGHDFAGIRILTYNASVDGSTLRGGPDVGLVNSQQPRDGHATAPEPRRRSYASVAASRPGSAASSSTSSTLIDQQAPSSFSQAQVVPPFPVPAPPATLLSLLEGPSTPSRLFLLLSSRRRIIFLPGVPVPRLWLLL
ncbi:hypothetical protein BDZ89DRAFT_615712 [Hymenopellis radicata]|nr:hypothetical protein BDZ89DRAFT_615712 [Hymenopellis radicata]